MAAMNAKLEKEYLLLFVNCVHTRGTGENCG
jgi:hypothetical protein